MSSSKINKLIIDILELADKLNNFSNEDILTAAPKYSKLENVIDSYNNFIDKLEIYNINLNNLSEYKANKFKQLDLYNKLVTVVKKDAKKTTDRIIGQMGGGLIKTFNFDLLYGDTNFDEKIDTLNQLQKNIKATSETYFTADIKKSKKDLITALREYKNALTELKFTVGSSKLSDYSENLKEFNEKLAILDKSIKSACNSGSCGKINLTPDIRNKLAKLKSSNSSKTTNMARDADESAKLKQNEARLNKTISENQRKIAQLEKTVKEYKQSLKSKGTMGVIPTLSSAVRFSKVGDLLGLPNSSLVQSLKQKRTPIRDTSGAKMDLGSIYRGQQQQLTSQGIDKLRELFSPGFINFLKSNNKLDALFLLNKYNLEKPGGFFKRTPDTSGLGFFCEFLKKLKAEDSYRAQALINEKLRLKDHTESLHNGLISLIMSFVNYDTSSFNVASNPDISILYKMLEDIINVSAMNEIITGKMFKLPKSQATVVGIELDAVNESKFTEGLKTVFSKLATNFTGNLETKLSKFSTLFVDLDNLLQKSLQLPNYLKNKFIKLSPAPKFTTITTGEIDNRQRINGKQLNNIISDVLAFGDDDSQIIVYLVKLFEKPGNTIDISKLNLAISYLSSFNLYSIFTDIKEAIAANIEAAKKKLAKPAASPP